MKGEWQPGALIPGEIDLANEFSCARATINRALRELSEEGLIERKRKAGTRVREAPLRQARFEIPLIRAEIEAAGGRYDYQLLQRLVVKASPWLQERFSLTGRQRALRLFCLHRSDGAPYQFEERWINLVALPEAEAADFLALSPNEWLVRAVPFSQVEISFSAVAAGEPAVAHLEIEKDTPVFLIERATWWAGQALTYVKLFHLPGHRIRARY